jgi:hypothetical protein
MQCIRTYDDFVGVTHVLLEFGGVQIDVYQDGMRLVEIDDAHPVFREGNGGVGQDVFDGGNHVTYRLYLNGFDG